MSWRDVIPARDREVYQAAGYGRPSPPGSAPALLVVDVTYGFVGREPLPILESIETYPNSCGADGWDAIPIIASLLEAGRERGIPIAYTRGVDQHKAEHAGRWRDKHPLMLHQPTDANDLVEEIAPGPDDLVLEKTKPSAFFGTPLAAFLIDRRVDTVIVTGCTTSGCVRATAVDAFSLGFRTVVVADAVFDRGRLSHQVNLFDLEQKYAEVLGGDAVASYLRVRDASTAVPPTM